MSRSRVLLVAVIALVAAIAVVLSISVARRTTTDTSSPAPLATSSPPSQGCPSSAVGSSASAHAEAAGVQKSLTEVEMVDSGSGPAISSSQLRFGVAVSGADATPRALAELSRSVGETPSLIMAYFDFHQPPPMAKLASLAAKGQTMVISWEPWTWGTGLTQPDYRTKNIADGSFDDYLASWAKALAHWNRPVLLRIGQEMNLPNYPWADGANGNSVGDYVSAWRHIHDVFKAAGADNVEWVWSPNVPTPTSEPFSEIFPGRSYVDYVALDGYNWGTTQSWSSWVDPCHLFSPGLSGLRTIAPGVPILITETGCAEAGGDKAAWSKDLVDYLSSQPDVVGLIMFNQDKEVDWRINSSPAALAAFALALKNR